MLTKEEAIRQGICIAVEPPEPITCIICKKKLHYAGLNLGQAIRTWIPQSVCGCKGSIEKKEQDEAQKAEQQRCLEMQKKVSKLFQQSKLGERFISRTFETFRTDKSNLGIYESCKKFADNFNEIKKSGMGIQISGSCGSGKTHLVASIANQLISQGTPVIFGTMINLLGKIKQSYNSDSKEDETEILKTYCNVDLLIIDDLGKEKPSEWVLEKLYNIINERYENNKCIVVTTNYSASNLITRLTVKDNVETAEAIVSRLHEMCKGLILDGDDHRKV